MWSFQVSLFIVFNAVLSVKCQLSAVLQEVGSVGFTSGGLMAGSVNWGSWHISLLVPSKPTLSCSLLSGLTWRITPVAESLPQPYGYPWLNYLCFMYLLVLLCTEFGFFVTRSVGQGSQKQTGDYNGVLDHISSL